MDAEKDNEVLTFREVFLGSRALELLVAGCPPLPPPIPPLSPLILYCALLCQCCTYQVALSSIISTMGHVQLLWRGLFEYGTLMIAPEFAPTPTRVLSAYRNYCVLV